jgi:putative ABC transport system substrate-binding protein
MGTCLGRFMNNRRKLVIAFGAGALAAPFASFAQQQGKVYRIGILSSSSRATSANITEVFTLSLRELGYVEGKNVVFESRYADGKSERLPALAADLVQLRVDVILATNTPPVQAAKEATDRIPIVFTTVADPVGSGFVASLARPGGNITGTSVMLPDLSAKRLQLLKEIVPKISRVAVFTISSEPQTIPQFAEAQRAAEVLGMKVFSIELQRREDFEKARAVLRKWRADSMYVVGSNMNFNNRALLAEFATMNRLPATFATKAYAEAGGLMSYGANYESNFRRAATFVDKILKGTKPADLPVEQPMTFELVINKKTANALGLKIPQQVLQRADKVIE